MGRTVERSNIVVNIQSGDTIHQVSQMAKSHPQASSGGFPPVSFPRGRWERAFSPWSSQTGCHRGREGEAETRERSISLGGSENSRISF